MVAKHIRTANSTGHCRLQHYCVLVLLGMPAIGIAREYAISEVDRKSVTPICRSDDESIRPTTFELLRSGANFLGFDGAGRALFEVDESRTLEFETLARDVLGLSITIEDIQNRELPGNPNFRIDERWLFPEFHRDLNIPDEFDRRSLNESELTFQATTDEHGKGVKLVSKLYRDGLLAVVSRYSCKKLMELVDTENADCTEFGSSSSQHELSIAIVSDTQEHRQKLLTLTDSHKDSIGVSFSRPSTVDASIGRSMPPGAKLGFYSERDPSKTLIAVLDSQVLPISDLRSRLYSPESAEFPDVRSEVKFMEHGTAIAAIIARTSPNSQILPIALNLTSQGLSSDAVIARKIADAVNAGAKIINASWVTAGCSDAVRLAIDAAADRGVIFVAAAGNGKTDLDGAKLGEFVRYPAFHTAANMVVVTSFNGRRLDANWGPTSVDVAAEARARIFWPDGEIQHIRYSSAAAARVSGLLGEILAKNSALTETDAILKLRQLTTNDTQYKTSWDSVIPCHSDIDKTADNCWP